MTKRKTIKPCENTVNGEHIIQKAIITYNEISNGQYIVYSEPVYADKCLACQKWIKLIEKTPIHEKG